MAKSNKESLLNEFETYLSLEVGLKKTSTTTTVRKLAPFLETVGEPECVTLQDCKNYIYSLRKKGCKKSYLKKVSQTLKHYTQFLFSRGYIDTNFSNEIPTIKTSYKPDVEPLTVEELKKLLETNREYVYQNKHRPEVEKAYDVIIKFLSLTGCRVSEATHLRVRQLNLSQSTVRFVDTKSGHDRTVPLPNSLQKGLKKLVQGKDSSGYVFIGVNGDKLLEKSVRRELKKRAKKAGIEKRVYPHLLRHSYVTHLRQQGVSLGRVADLVGHENINTTKGYDHLLLDDLRVAAGRHPLARSSLTTEEKIEFFKENALSPGIHKEPDLEYSVHEEGNKVIIRLEAR